MREGKRKESWMEAEVREGELVEKEREEKEREKKVRWRRGREKTRASLGCTRTGATQTLPIKVVRVPHNKTGNLKQTGQEDQLSHLCRVHQSHNPVYPLFEIPHEDVSHLSTYHQ